MNIRKSVIILAFIALLIAAGGVLINIFLPEKLKEITVRALEERTGQEAFIGKVRVNILKGVVLKDITLRRDGNVWLSARTINVDLNLLSILSKRVLVSLTLDAPYAYLERRPDGSLPLATLFKSRETKEGERAGFSVIVDRITVNEGSIEITDHAVSPAFHKKIRNMYLNANLALPAAVDFQLYAASADSPARFNGKGRYLLLKKQLEAAVSVEQGKPEEFQPYFGNLFVVEEGVINGTNLIESDGSLISVSTDSAVNGLIVSKDGNRLSFDGKVNAVISFKPGQGLLGYTGKTEIGSCKIELPGHDLEFSGPVQFSENGVSWKGAKINYAGHKYSSAGRISDYADPGVELGVYSEQLRLEASAESRNRLLKISRLKAELPKSDIYVTGTVDLSRLPALPADLSARMKLELSDLGLFLAGYPAWERSGAKGAVDTDIRGKGDLREPELLNVEAGIKSDRVRAYGFTAGNINIDYSQSKGTAKSLFNFSFYNGTVNGEANAGLTTSGIPYYFKAAGEKISLEDFTNETPLKERDLQGIVDINGLFNGRLDNLADSSGNGSVSVTDGKLFQLEILRGLSQFLFPELLSVTFDRASSKYTVKDHALFASDMSLVSRTIALAGNGRLEFDGDIDALIHVQVSPQLVPNLPKLRDLAGLILKQTRQIVAVKISGTMKNPEYNLRQPLISDIFRGLRDILPGASRSR